jgi:hypothetical protein
LFPSFGRFSVSVETFGIGTDAGSRVTGGAGDAGLGGEGGGACDAPAGLTGLEEPREVGVDVADRGAWAERLRRSAGRAAGPRLRDKGCAGGENEATTRPTFVVSGGTTGGGPSACGPVVRRSDEAQTEAPTVAKAGKRGPIRATIFFISAPATRRLAFSTPKVLFGAIGRSLERIPIRNGMRGRANVPGQTKKRACNQQWMPRSQ